MVFSLRQLQEKCREQQMPLYIAFIDLTKAFNLVSREGLFRILSKIGCPPKLHSLIEPFHTNMQGTVQFNGSISEPFNISSGVKQSCVLAPNPFRNLLCLASKTCIWHIKKRDLPAYKIRWQAFQSCPPASQDQSA